MNVRRLNNTLFAFAFLIVCATNAVAQNTPCSCTLKRGDPLSKVIDELHFPSDADPIPAKHAYPFIVFYLEHDGVQAYLDESKNLVQLRFSAPSTCKVAGTSPGDLVMTVKEQNGRPLSQFNPDENTFVWTYSNDPTAMKGEKELFRVGEYLRYWFVRSEDNKAVVKHIISNACSIPLRKNF